MAAHNRSVVTFFVLVFVLSAGAFFLARQSTPQLPMTSTPIRSTPAVIPSPPASEAHAPDGSVTLISRAVKNSDGTATYEFSASGLTGIQILPAGTSRKIFTKTVGSGVSMMIPANAWAPENRYVFLEEKDGIGEKRFFVVRATGEPFVSGAEYLDVTALFAEKKTGYTFREATGWASPTLLIITTDKDQKTRLPSPGGEATGGQARGPSYWFEIPSGAFLQLAR